MKIIEAKDLVKIYGKKEVVSNVDLTVEKGETFGLLGPNGAGKSTTISMLVGLIKPTSGSIKIKGMDALKKSRDVRRCIGLVPQDIALYPTLSAEDNLRFWGKMYGVRGNRLKKRVDEVLQIVNLEERRKERVETYSGGMKRRINIAAALLHEPEIIIMDEPTVGIDPQSRNHILETVKTLNNQGTTIIYTSHYMEEVNFLCNKVAIMDGGKVIAFDEIEKLKRSVVDAERIMLKLSSVSSELVKDIESLEEITRVEKEEEDVLEIYTKNDAQALIQVIPILTRHNINILESKIEEPNLEMVFLKLTGKKLRD
jgi:ABC-2 type transport system ATP-binding protein